MTLNMVCKNCGGATFRGGPRDQPESFDWSCASCGSRRVRFVPADDLGYSTQESEYPRLRALPSDERTAS